MSNLFTGFLSILSVVIIDCKGIGTEQKIPVQIYLNQNFNQFKLDFNSAHTEKINAKKILASKRINIKDEYGYIFDLDKGMIVCTDNYEILYHKNYDISFENQIMSTATRFNGFTFYDKNNNEIALIENPILGTKILANSCSTNNFDPFTNDGKIPYNELNSYNGRYLIGYELYIRLWAYSVQYGWVVEGLWDLRYCLAHLMGVSQGDNENATEVENSYIPVSLTVSDKHHENEGTGSYLE